MTRVEDRALLLGDGRFLDDLVGADCLHVVFVRADVPAGDLAGVDVSDAVGMPGVLAVLTAADLDVSPMLAVSGHPWFEAEPVPILAERSVHFVGEPLAMVVADSRYHAEDAAEFVYPDVTPRPATVEAPPPEAMATGAHGATCFAEFTPFDTGDVDERLGSAAVVVDLDITTARVSASPMETRGCRAEWDRRDGRLVLHTSTQIPHIVRTVVAGCLGLTEGDVRVVAPDVGGGFGQKAGVSREEVAVAAAARLLGRPLAWVEDRQENLLSATQAHHQTTHIRAGFTAEGVLDAVDVGIVCDAGAFSMPPFTAALEPMMMARELPGPYRLSSYRARVASVRTNKPPMGAYRGVGRPQCVLAIERAMDEGARQLGLDPVELRRRNVVAADEFPYAAVTGVTYDPGTYLECLEQAAALVDAAGWPQRQAALRRAGRVQGLGIACFNESTGLGSKSFAPRRLNISPAGEEAVVTMAPDGTVTVAVGAASQGQGHATVFARVVAERLGVSESVVRVVAGDTDATPFGWGTFASRGAVLTGGACRRAAAELRLRLLALAAGIYDLDEGTLDLADGVLTAGGQPTECSVADLARIAHHEPQRLPPGWAGLRVTASWDLDYTYANAVHVAHVEVDVRTGAVEVLRFVVVEDCGTILDVDVVDGQVRGGVAQGIGKALYEELSYDPDGGQPLATSFIDYLVPTASEVPPIEIHHLETPFAGSGTGAKGVGESGTVGAPAAVANAVCDALAHLGVRLDTLPYSPQRILAAVGAAGGPPP